MIAITGDLAFFIKIVQKYLLVIIKRYVDDSIWTGNISLDMESKLTELAFDSKKRIHSCFSTADIQMKNMETNI